MNDFQIIFKYCESVKGRGKWFFGRYIEASGIRINEKNSGTLKLFVGCHERVQSIESVTMTIQSKIPSVFNQNF